MLIYLIFMYYLYNKYKLLANSLISILFALYTIKYYYEQSIDLIGNLLSHINIDNLSLSYDGLSFLKYISILLCSTYNTRTLSYILPCTNVSYTILTESIVRAAITPLFLPIAISLTALFNVNIFNAFHYSLSIGDSSVNA